MKPVLPKSRPISEGLGVAATDVITNLFIFFFIAFSLLATFSKRKLETDHRQQKDESNEHVQPIDLPVSVRTDASATPGAIAVELLANGALTLDGRSVRREELTTALRLLLASGARPVVLRAHRALALGEAVEVVDLAWAAGPSGVSLATVEPR